MCGSTQFSYPNTSGFSFAEDEPDYGCVIRPLNASWFYLQIAQSGDIQLRIEQSTIIGEVPNLDVDFVLYGPFSNPVSPCLSELTSTNIVDCSYEIDFVEFVGIPNTEAGEYYLLLVTNYSGSPGFITVTQTAGIATTNCVLVEDPVLVNKEACEGESITLEATTANAANYIWYVDDGSGTDNYFVINGINTSSHEVIIPNQYKAEVFDSNDVLIEKYQFTIQFAQFPTIPSNIQDYSICDSFGPNNGIGMFDLSTKNNELLNGLDPLSFLVTYYDDENNAHQGIGALPFLYTNTNLQERIYVRIENILSKSLACYDVASFLINVNILPEVVLDNNYTLCVNTNGSETIETPPFIDTGYNTVDYSFVWSLNGTVLTSENNGFIFPLAAGKYSVEVTERITGCSNIAITTVVLSEPPEVYAEVISYAFIEENNIDVIASGIGIQDYEFSLDSGPWQTSSGFQNVSIGEHSITVRNLSGCGKTTITIMVMDYPVYFTPNGDGIHDTWNIAGIKNQLQAEIYIYDRYGKLLKQLSPTSAGWDGTYNGALMPTEDYWFAVSYIEPKDGTERIFRSHFSLKR